MRGESIMTSQAKPFLLFINKERANMAAPCGSEITCSGARFCAVRTQVSKPTMPGLDFKSKPYPLTVCLWFVVSQHYKPFIQITTTNEPKCV